MEQEIKNGTYIIPEGFTAKIKDGKIIVEKQDENIRKEIIEFLTYGIWKQSDIDKVKQSQRYAKWVAYLEEQQPAEWSDDFQENIRILLHNKLTWHSDDGKMSSAVLIDDKTLKDIISGIWFYVGKEALKYPNKELSQPEWSEEDEKMKQRILTHLYSFIYPNSLYAEDASECISWLKSLRPQPHWKPSDEQMEWLESAVRLSTNKPRIHGIIISLYEQLKRL